MDLKTRRIQRRQATGADLLALVEQLVVFLRSVKVCPQTRPEVKAGSLYLAIVEAFERCGMLGMESNAHSEERQLVPRIDDPGCPTKDPAHALLQACRNARTAATKSWRSYPTFARGSITLQTSPAHSSSSSTNTCLYLVLTTLDVQQKIRRMLSCKHAATLECLDDCQV
jgi:hypothetical protein